MVFSTLGYIIAAQRYLENLWLVAIGGSLMLIVAFVWTKIKQQRQKNVLGLLCLCQVAVYVIVSFVIFPAIADTRSEKDLAQNLLNYSNQRLGLYEFYSTSAVYYSGKTAVKLTSSETVASPQTELSWSSKYTMPTESLVSFMTNSKAGSAVIVVPEEKREQFLDEIKNCSLQLWKTTDRFSYYHFGN